MRIRKYALAALIVTAGLTAVGCSGTSSPAPAARPAPTGGAASTSPSAMPTPDTQAAAVAVKISDSRYGQILTDQMGRTLYGFVPDKTGLGKCGDVCIASWPPLTSKAAVTSGSGISAALLGKMVRTEGTVQAVYGDWPLYYYAGDVQPGDVDGQGVNGVWFVIGADGKLIKKAD